MPWDGELVDEHAKLEKLITGSTLDDWLATGGEKVDDQTHAFLRRVRDSVLDHVTFLMT